jgi:hypothetical protein
VPFCTTFRLDGVNMLKFLEGYFSDLFNFTMADCPPAKKYDPYLSDLAAKANAARLDSKDSELSLPDLPIVNVLGNSLTSQVFSAYLNDRGISSRTLLHVDDVTQSDKLLACLPADYTTTKLLGYALMHGMDVVVTGSSVPASPRVTDDTGITILYNEKMLLDWIDILKSS